MTRNFLVAQTMGKDEMDFVRQTLCTSVQTLILTMITPSSSDAVNFWFCALSDSRSVLVATEKSFLVSLAPSSPYADTSVGTERSAETDADVGVGWGWNRLSSPPEQLIHLLKRPENV